MRGSYRPQLTQGRFVEENDLWTYSSQGHDLVLPSEAVEFLKRCNGSFSVKEIVGVLYSKGISFSFMAIKEALNSLKDHELLQNPQMMNEVEVERLPADKSTVPQLLRRQRLFKGLDEKVVDQIFKSGSLKTFEKGDVILKRGATSTSVCLLVSGEAGVYSHFRGFDSSNSLAQIPAGGVFGESAVQGQLRTADVVAMTSTKVFQFLPESISDPFSNNQMSRNIQLRLLLLQILKTHPFFKKSPDETSSAFLQSCQVVRVPAHHTILQQGDTSEDFYILIHGSAMVIQDGAPLAQLQAGHYFGEVAALKRTERTASIVSQSESVLLKVSGASFIKALADDFYLAEKVEELMKERELQEKTVTITLNEERTLSLDEEEMQLLSDWEFEPQEETL